MDGVFGLDDNEMYFLRYYFTISRKFYENRIRYGHVPCIIEIETPGAFGHIPPGFGGIPLLDVWKKRILDLPDDAPTGEIIVNAEDIPYENQEKYENAVLIAPAAFTNRGIPKSFWEKLVVKIRNMGYEVFCNSGGLVYDTLIEGSTELVLSTKELIVNAGFFSQVQICV